MGLSIRQAGVGDRDRIVLFNQAMAKETEGRMLDRATLTRGVEAMLEDPARGRYFVAEDDRETPDVAAESADQQEPAAEIVGQLAVTTEWSDWRNGDVWWIQSVYVAKSHRRRGIYRQLHEHVRGMAREAGVVGLRLYVERDNAAAQSAYEILGMHPSSYVMYEELWPKV
jgi:GNAT superfamily N-acetyltransferase